MLLFEVLFQDRSTSLSRGYLPSQEDLDSFVSDKNTCKRRKRINIKHTPGLSIYRSLHSIPPPAPHVILTPGE